MQNQDQPSNIMFMEEETTNIRQELEKYLYYWKWFILSLVLALIGAYLYLRYTPNAYEVSTTILIDDGSKGGMAPELAVFEELGMGENKKNLQNEITILKSRSLTEQVAKNLNLNVSYFKEGQIRHTEIFKSDVPFKINFLNDENNFIHLGASFNIKVTSPTTYNLINPNDDVENQYTFGEKVSFHGIDMILTPNKKTNSSVSHSYLVAITPLKNVVQNLRNRIQVNLLNANASVVELKLQSRSIKKSQVILDEWVRQYNKNAIEYKSLIGKNTDAFIKERLALIEKELVKVDKSAETFKTSNKLTDISTETGIVLEKNSAIEQEIIELSTQLKLVDLVMSHISENSNELIPESIGLSESDINSNSSRYNEILLERTRIAKSSGKNNPVLINLDTQLEQIKESITQGLVNLKSSLKVSLNEAKRQEQQIASRITSAPKQEREYRDIQRQQQIIETLYLFLLQKREENAISLAVTAPNAKLIDKAQSTGGPVSPKRQVVYLGAIILGVLVPFSIIFLIQILDNKIHTPKELEALVKAPFVGDVPTTVKQDRMVSKDDRGSLAEAFRMLRTNVNFLLGNTENTGQTIFVTSTIPGEGKTFVSINLSTVFAMTNKKILLIGADIRKPKFIEYLNVETAKMGLTEYLADKTIDPLDIISPQQWGFDMIQSGAIPPNPAELLMNGRLDELLAYGKANYDFIIVDTAPVNAVTDTMQIASKADLFLYVVRANYLDKRLLDIPKHLYNEKRVQNMALVMNGTDPKKGYGYGYGGYGYGEVEETKKPWWKFRS
ncbi:GumC family protein [Pseudotamlana agarivorans]|uniref:GumC family protein n=1 Tax=Pseudotamlana agarivorans TaxID=481183 RepID=UPI000A9C13B8|nr:polysaccharide biosynthesis tyrosine autokinase [Tamlana agarivorans]